jgi:polyribonucleotide nucleotidyltransferase
MQVAINAIKEFCRRSRQCPPWDWTPPAERSAEGQPKPPLKPPLISEAYTITEKQVRYASLGAIKKQAALAQFAVEGSGVTTMPMKCEEFEDLKYRTVRDNILTASRVSMVAIPNDRACAGRPGTGVLPRAHGSALFTRGETQAWSPPRWAGP